MRCILFPILFPALLPHMCSSVLHGLFNKYIFVRLVLTFGPIKGKVQVRDGHIIGKNILMPTIPALELVVEDEKNIRANMVRFFTMNCYKTRTQHLGLWLP